MSLVAVEIVES